MRTKTKGGVKTVRLEIQKTVCPHCSHNRAWKKPKGLQCTKCKRYHWEK